MPFRDREQAARLLARELRAYKGQNPLIPAIPRILPREIRELFNGGNVS